MAEALYRSIVRLAKGGFRVLGHDFDIQGAEHLPAHGPALIALNHISYVDFVYGGYPADFVHRRVRFMAKRELFDHKVTGPIMRACRHIPVDRAAGEASLREAVRHLRAGELVGIFPEATISRALVVKELKTGAVRIAAETGAPIVPMTLWGTQRLYTKDHPRDFSRGTPIAITVGEPWHPGGTDPAADTLELHRRLSDLLDATIQRYPERPAGAWWLPAAYGGSAPSLEEAARLDAEEKAARAARRAQRTD